MPAHLVVDAANVVGSRPDGWWRDRAGAATRLVTALVAALDDPATLAAAVGLPSVDLQVHVVLEGAARSAQPPSHPALTVLRADADGDSTIAAHTAVLVGPVVVVTADRGLRTRVRAGGATTIGPTPLRALLDTHTD